MKIYTRQGDEGQTSLFGGQKVLKSDSRVQTYGTVDELNAALGCAASAIADPALKDEIAVIQNELFNLGAELATPNRSMLTIPLIDDAPVGRLEAAIDRMETSLPKLTTFILPSGGIAGSLMHLARAICRRAERETVAFRETEPDVRPEVIRYLNRLGDYLFVAARYANHLEDCKETAWRP
jgi:cob(I)alamin adenosyltransferase